MHTLSRYLVGSVIGAVLIAAAIVAPVLAQEEKSAQSPLTPEAETKLLDLASSFAEPPLVEIKADLSAPVTVYTVQLVPAEKTRIDDIIKRAKEEIGLSGLVTVEAPEDRWYAKVSCGTFSAANRVSAWQHPEGEAPDGCPHEDGTSHTGTIHSNGNVFLSFSKDAVNVLYVIYGFECVYNGSEKGTERCTGEIEQFSGFYGGMFSERYGHNTDDNSVDPWNKAWIYVGVTVIAAGTGFTFWRRRSQGEK